MPMRFRGNENDEPWDSSFASFLCPEFVLVNESRRVAGSAGAHEVETEFEPDVVFDAEHNGDARLAEAEVGEGETGGSRSGEVAPIHNAGGDIPGRRARD